MLHKKNLEISEIYNRFSRIIFSFKKKENLATKFLYAIFCLFPNQKIGFIKKKLIFILTKFSDLNFHEIFDIQKKRLILKKRNDIIFTNKINILSNIKMTETKQLAKDGYLNVSHLVHLKQNDFYNAAIKLKYFNSQVPIQSNKKEISLNSNSNYFSLSPENEILDPYYKMILKNENLKLIINDYLQSNSKLYSINTMFSTSHKKKHYVTDLHRDYDDEHFLSLFIYWTDTFKNDGATYFVPKSHRKSLSKNKNGLHLEGKAGSVYLIDSFGLHSGNKNIKKDRLVSWFRFSKNQINVASFDNKDYLFFEYYNELWK